MDVTRKGKSRRPKVKKSSRFEMPGLLNDGYIIINADKYDGTDRIPRS